ncbi:MAG: hypothetical protein JXP73_21825 [Deltaproteobacteria bacterium]|jgi:acyl-CoA thioesterase FadM|nr:hypothetical protein [Deltaproteobacteria bacterium]
MAMPDMRVICGDTDRTGTVCTGNYLRCLEAARTKRLRASGIRWRDIEVARAICSPEEEAKAHHKLPARYEDVSAAEARPDDRGGASLRFDYRVARGVC